MTTIRSTVAACAGLLAALLLQAPAGADLAAGNGGHRARWAAFEQSSPSPAPKTSAQGPSRQPGTQRDGPRGPGGASGLTDARWQWWNDGDVKRQLALTEDTVRTINAIVRERNQKYFPMWKSLTAEFEKLNRMTSDPAVDETSYEAQATKVYYLQSQLDTSRTVMNFRIYKQLRPDQLKKLEELVQRRDTRSGRDRGPGRE